MRKMVFCLATAAFGVAWAGIPDQINGINEENRRVLFGKLLASEGCGEVKRTFFQGLDRRGAGYWSVQCKSKAYQLMVEDNASGSSKVVNCEALKLMGTRCFVLFK